MPLKELAYNRNEALAYAAAWALKRNPSYYNFDEIGGDCTNFMSQCLYAGSKVMNHKPTTGWYYYSLSQRAAAWTSVDHFYRFVTTNKGSGPFGHEADITETEVGDIIQLQTQHDYFHHACIIVQKDHPTDLNQILIACHTYDFYKRPLGSYDIKKMRCIRIEGVRKG